MISQEQILKKQNENKMLRCQFAARVYFNNAELLNYASWAFSVLSALTLFLPNGDSTIIMVTPLIIDIIAYLFHYFAEKEVNIAAKLRNYFDSVVLNIHPENYQ